MILEQNYRKIAQYTEKSFKLYSRRYLADLSLQILRKKQNMDRPLTSILDRSNTSTFLEKDTQIDLKNSQKEKNWQKNNYFTKTFKHIDHDDQKNIPINLSYLKYYSSYFRYGDFIYLQIYNSNINPSDKNQRVRVFFESNALRYCKFIQLQCDDQSIKKSMFQIVNPFDSSCYSILKGDSLFCLKELSSGKYLCFNQKQKITNLFGYEISLQNFMNPDCFLQFHGLEAKTNNIVSYMPVGIKLGNLYLRAQGFQISCNIEGSVFYFDKLSINEKNRQQKFVRIKSIQAQRYLSSSEIEMNKLMSKRSFSNVTIEDENGSLVKENQLVFATWDFNKPTQSDIQIIQTQKETLTNIWILRPISSNNFPYKQQMKIIHAVSGRCLVVKHDRILKLSSNPTQASFFELFQNTQNKIGIQSLNFEKTINSQTLDDNIKKQNDGNNEKIYQIKFEQEYLSIMRRVQDLRRFQLNLIKNQDQGRQKIQEDKKILFELCDIDLKQKKIIEEFIQAQLMLKKVLGFIQKVGFVLQERSQTLKFCVQQIKKSRLEILYHNQIIRSILSKIKLLITSNSYHMKIPIKVLQDHIKQLKILEILISIAKIINLKISKTTRSFQDQIPNQNLKVRNHLEGLERKFSQTPFEVCFRHYSTLLQQILDVVYLLVKNNSKCSSVVIQQTSFFNKLLINNPDKIGSILLEAIKNLSFFTTKASKNDCIELLLWGKLIETISENNIKVQTTYINVIAQVLIDPNDRGIIPYQNKCRESLFNQRNKKKIIPRFGVQDQKPTITFQINNLNQFLFSNPNLFQIQPYSSGQACFFIEDFFENTFEKRQEINRNKDYVEYLISIIGLMRNMCKDRNKKLIKIADEYGFDKLHLIACLKSGKINWYFKIQYLLLYSSIYVDQDPFLQFERRQVKCHIWTKIKQCNLQSKTALIFKQYSDLSSAVQKLRQFDIDIVPFIDNYLIHSRQNIGKLFHFFKQRNFQQWKDETQNQLNSFETFLKFLFEAMNFGYFSIHHIKKYVYFVICHYQSVCNLFECVYFSNINFEKIESFFIGKRQLLLNQILKILSLNEAIWIDLNCINLLKLFQKNYSDSDGGSTAIELRELCWKVLNHELPFLTSEENIYNFAKNCANVSKKKTTSKNMFLQEIMIGNGEEKSNNEFDEQVGKFLIRMLLVHSQMPQSESYSQVISVISQRQKRNFNIYENLSSFLILNGKKQQNLYRDYSGRTAGKILNVNRIYELVLRIKNSSNDQFNDPDSIKKTKEKLLQLNNLVNKIRREMVETKDENRILFRKMQKIIQKLNIDCILLQLLQFSHHNIYSESITNLYKFYLEFISENDSNKKKLCSHFLLFLKNIKIQKGPLLISELYKVLTQPQKRQYMQVLFRYLSLNSSEGGDQLMRKDILETIYRILKKIKQKQIIVEIKSQLTFQIFKENELNCLLKMDVEMSAQYINVLCELAPDYQFLRQKIRRIYSKNFLKNIMYEQNNYFRKSSILKFFYHFYIENNLLIEIQEIEDIIFSFILPQIQHLPSVMHYSTLQNLQIQQKENYSKKSSNQTHPQSQQDIASLKRKFQDLILLDKIHIQPSQQQKYWDFIFNLQDQNQMSLVNFVILLLKIQTQSIFSNSALSKKLSKSPKYNYFIQYITELSEFMREICKHNSNLYQRKLLHKLQQILIIHEQRNGGRHKTVNLSISQEDKKLIGCFFQELSKIITQEDISYRQILECADVSNIELGKRRAGQNIEKLILEQQFIGIIKRLRKHVSNIKQFDQVINQKKLSLFFNLYKCNKVRKINIYKFLQKLIQYLESLKSKNINQLNNPSDSLKSQQKYNYDCLDFIDTINHNELIQTHFISYYEMYQVVLKFLLLSKWKNQQQKYFKLVLEDLKKQSLSQYFQPFSQQSQNSSSFLVELYLSRMCGNRTQRAEINDNEQESFKQEQDCTNTMFQINLRQEKGSVTFSKIVLLILKEINNRQNMKVITSEKSIRYYIRKKLQQTISQSSCTFNQILMELIINFNQQKLHSQFIPNPIKLTPQPNLISYFLPQLNYNKIKVFSKEKGNKFQNRFLAQSIYEQIIKILDKKISLISQFNFRYSVESCQRELNYTQTHVPSNFKFKLSILSYGLNNGLISHQKIWQIQSCFIKIFYLWAVKKYDFQDINWLTILQSIIDFIDQHLKNINNFAFLLSNSSVYIERYQELVNQCCLLSIKTTNLKSMTKVHLLNLLTQFHIKFYLQNQNQSLAKIFNKLSFELLAKTANMCYEQSIQPKLECFQNEIYCDMQNPQHQLMCTYEFCNEQKLTKNDHIIMETFLTLLIIIQLSITLHNKKLFTQPLSSQNSNVLLSTYESFRKPKLKSKNSQNLNWIQFYKKYIGLVYFTSQDASLITLHFKIPYIEKYVTKSFKQEALYLLKRQKESCIQQQLLRFSKYFEFQLEQRKIEQKIPFLPLILSYKKIIRRAIIVVNFIHVILLINPTLQVNEVIFYPFTVLFIFLRIIFTFSKYKKSLNIIICMKQQKELSFHQKIVILMNEKVFISGFLVLLYVISFLQKNVFGFIIILEILTTREAFNFFMLLMRTFVLNFINVLLSFGIIMIFFGVINWEKVENQTFLNEISNVFKQFYLFTISNMKIATIYKFISSKQIPLSFFLYLVLVVIFIYRNLLFFMAEMKKEKDRLNQVEDRCIICKRKKIDLQSQGSSFQEHIKFQHNVWHYLYFFIYLRKKQKNNLKNIELLIKQRIENKNYGFMRI